MERLCKKCKYVEREDRGDSYEKYVCHFTPESVYVSAYHWCYQFKSKKVKSG